MTLKFRGRVATKDLYHEGQKEKTKNIKVYSSLHAVPILSIGLPRLTILLLR